RLVAIDRDVWNDARLDQAVRTIGGKLARDLDPRDTAQQQREPAVRQLLGADDAADAPALVHRRPALVRGLVTGAQARDAHELAAGEAVARQLAVARLEHVQRQQAARQQHAVRQRKDRQGREGLGIGWLEERIDWIVHRIVLPGRLPED